MSIGRYFKKRIDPAPWPKRELPAQDDIGQESAIPSRYGHESAPDPAPPKSPELQERSHRTFIKEMNMSDQRQAGNAPPPPPPPPDPEPPRTQEVQERDQKPGNIRRT